MGARLASLAVALLVAAGAAFAQSAKDPNFALPNEVVTVQRDGYSISGLATHLEGPARFRYGVALFPGSPGIMRIHVEGGEPRHGQVGNFLVRSRRHWLDEETLTLAIDAPSDQWNSFNLYFRASSRYGEDVKALLEAATKRYGIVDWSFVGTSQGSVSAYHAARMNPQLAQRVVFTSSVFASTRVGPGLSNLDLGELKMPLLWVHHRDDSCQYTPYGEAQRAAARTMSPLVTVTGGGPYRGGACEAFFPHGYVGQEREVVLAMRDWIRTGRVPPDIAAP
jgi:pimeloyl-ACP methyl ester carboxylesterase